MSDIEALYDFVKTLLEGKTSLRGVGFVQENDQSLSAVVDEQLKRLGISAQIGSVSGENQHPDSAMVEVVLRFGVRCQENAGINRDSRVNRGNVANEAARLALTTINVAEKVTQTDTSITYWLKAKPESSAANWAELLTATKVMELIIRSLHFEHPTASTTIVFVGFDENNSPIDVQANFEVLTRLDPTPVP